MNRTAATHATAQHRQNWQTYLMVDTWNSLFRCMRVPYIDGPAERNRSDHIRTGVVWSTYLHSRLPEITANCMDTFCMVWFL